MNSVFIFQYNKIKISFKIHLKILASHFRLLFESQTLKVFNTIILTNLSMTVYLMAISVGLWGQTFLLLGKNRDIKNFRHYVLNFWYCFSNLIFIFIEVTFIVTYL